MVFMWYFMYPWVKILLHNVLVSNEKVFKMHGDNYGLDAYGILVIDGFPSNGKK